MAERFVRMNIEGVDLSMTGTWYKGEKPVMYYRDGTGSPGSPPEYEIGNIWITSDPECTDIYPLLGPVARERIESRAIEILLEDDKERSWHLDERT